jgi:hypothetical protein
MGEIEVRFVGRIACPIPETLQWPVEVSGGGERVSQEVEARHGVHGQQAPFGQGTKMQAAEIDFVARDHRHTRAALGVRDDVGRDVGRRHAPLEILEYRSEEIFWAIRFALLTIHYSTRLSC